LNYSCDSCLLPPLNPVAPPPTQGSLFAVYRQPRGSSTPHSLARSFGLSSNLGLDVVHV
uniref:Velvet domain-containing protein n=1 Tax=Mesocestoides corti TaxID=53468 RepID=A0A5K3FWF6_MESCO